MKRKYWVVIGIIITILVVIGFTLWQKGRPDDMAETGKKIPVLNLAYCTEEQVKPCIVSFGLDADENMLVNFLLPDQPFPRFYLKVLRDEGEVVYQCQGNELTSNNAYCVGRKLPPGEILHLMLFSVRDDTLLAEGDLSIIGLAFPGIEIAISTPTGALTETPSPTNSPDFVLPTATRTRFPVPTKTEPAYPNPDYPNPRYP